MERQFYGFCMRCGKQILLTKKHEASGWWACDPYIKRFSFSRENGVRFFTPDGRVFYGIPGPLSGGGAALGYLPHTCQNAQNQAKQRPVNQNL